MYLIGASGHAKVIMEILQNNGKKVKALFDDNPEISDLMGVPVLGPVRDSRKHSGEYIIGIGDDQVRREFAIAYSHKYATAVDPSAVVSSSCSLGEGTVVMANACVNGGAVIGRHVIINTSASIDHDCVIGDFAHVSPNATLAGGTRVGEGSQIGAGAVVIPNIKIGKHCTVGAGAVIIDDVPDGATVVGNPGKILETSHA